MKPIIIGLGLLVFILGISVFYFQEGFQATQCNTILNCADCANTDGCGWCTNAKKCVKQNRFGQPMTICNMKYFVTSATQCGATRPSFLNKQVSNELTGTGPAPNINKKKQPPALIGGNCPSTDKIVEKAETRLNDIIKRVVETEMNKYNVPLVVEGFFDKNQDIATMLLGSVKDKVTKMVDSSIEAKGYTYTPPA
jgi:hypothetical protein